MSMFPALLIVDDEMRSLETLRRILEDDFDLKIAPTVVEAERILQQEWVQIILCDQRMPETTGVEFLKKVREQWPEVIRMIISGYADSEDTISAVNDAGIYQYISKPWHPDNLLLTLRNASNLFELQRQNEALAVELKMTPGHLDETLTLKREKLRDNFQCDDGIVRMPDSSMNGICDKIRRIAPYDVSVLLAGESDGYELTMKNMKGMKY